MKIRPVHHAILTYAEWCCDTARPWPKLSCVAYDLARDETDVQRAMNDLVTWGLVSERYDERGLSRVLRLGDGRETAPYIHVIHKRDSVCDPLQSDLISARKSS